MFSICSLFKNKSCEDFNVEFEMSGYKNGKNTYEL